MRPSAGVAVAFGAVFVYGAFLLRGQRDLFGQVFGAALLVQMFGASTGYADRARRGHFDPLLVGRSSRWSVALAHWLLSIAPGLVLWFLLAILGALDAPAEWPVALTPAGLAALVWVSTAAWMVTLLLPRYSGGILWLALLVVLAALHDVRPQLDAFLGDEATWSEALPKARAALAVPIALVGRPEAAGARTLALVALATVVALALGVLLIEQLDGLLRDPS